MSQQHDQARTSTAHPLPDQSASPALERAQATPMPGNAGKVRSAVLLWALGVPIPLVLLFVLLRGCVS